MGAPKSCENFNLQFPLHHFWNGRYFSPPPPPRYATDPTLTLDVRKSIKKIKLKY